jgi:hypothetical protein
MMLLEGFAIRVTERVRQLCAVVEIVAESLGGEFKTPRKGDEGLV